MITVVIYLEFVALGTGKLARYGACALLTYGDAVKATGQYLGSGQSRAAVIDATVGLALGSLKRACAVKIYSSSIVRNQKQKSLFEQAKVEWVYLPPGSHYRERATHWAAYEIALGGEVTDSILELAANAAEVSRRALVAS